MPEVEFNNMKLLIEELCRDHYQDEILRFFARHPYARFDKLVLLSSLGLGDVTRAERAFKTLRDQTLIETKDAGPSLCWLTRREPHHSAVKAALAPKAKSPEVLDRLNMMQLIMPLTACSVVGA